MAEVIDKEEPSMAYVGWGGEISPLVFRPLKHGPTVEVSNETMIDMSDLKIAQGVKDAITQHVAKFL